LLYVATIVVLTFHACITNFSISFPQELDQEEASVDRGAYGKQKGKDDSSERRHGNSRLDSFGGSRAEFAVSDSAKNGAER
jgi:hypothetical protein